MKKLQANIYDFPHYYDLVFGSDTAAELRFLRHSFSRFVQGEVRRVFEPACGTGRLLYKLGRQDGLEVGGVDLNPKAVDFCNRRLERYGIHGRALVGDMANFDVSQPYDAAFNTINSFRHLPDEGSAIKHLQCVAEAVRPGGIYALGLHLTPTAGEATDEESWSARRGQLAIKTHMWPIDKDPVRRVERFGIAFDIYKPTDSFRIEDVLVLRSYTLSQFHQLIAAVPQWQWVETFDFRYDIRRPIELGPESEDIVAILRRRS
ncbi:MAG: N,N-dimethyltransferase [Pirellulaceae bacterium]|nr:MAG: N,N-dimethyltransferase [Pirellulaceae bacterium]